MKGFDFVLVNSIYKLKFEKSRKSDTRIKYVYSCELFEQFFHTKVILYREDVHCLQVTSLHNVVIYMSTIRIDNLQIINLDFSELITNRSS